MEATYRQHSLGGSRVQTSGPATPPVPATSIGTFMHRLARQGVTFDLVADALDVAVPLGALSVAERNELAARRDEIEFLIRVALTPSQPAVRVPEAYPGQLMFGEVA